MILHIPHSSTFIPEHYNSEWINDPLEAIRVLTDHYTDVLFDYPASQRIVSPISRIICDVERFESGEEMEKRFGMGIVYEYDHLQNPLRSVTLELKNEIIDKYYRPHHRALYDAIVEELLRAESAMIVDCHSFNDEQLQHVENTLRPDICIGTDLFHTPTELVLQLVQYLQKYGYSVLVNEPFAGTMVPREYYHKDARVKSVMIEINKRLYLDEAYQKMDDFAKIKSVITEMLNIIHNRTL